MSNQFEIKKLSVEIGNRLRKWLENSSYQTQTNLANSIEGKISQATISRWLKGNGIGALALVHFLQKKHGSEILDTLFESQSPYSLIIRNSNNESLGQLRWGVNLPSYVSQNQYNACEQGIRFFHNIIIEGMTVEEATIASTYAGEQPARAKIYHALQIALSSGALSLTNVPRNTLLENKLIDWAKDPLTKRSRLKDVRVAVVPRNAKGYHSCTTIRTEYVSWLASTTVLPYVKRGIVGIGGGYTLRRMAELSVSAEDFHSGTTWTPLVTYEDKMDGSVNADTDANYTVQSLMAKHPNSNCLIYHFHEWDEELIKNGLVKKAHGNLETSFVSVNGGGRKNDDEEPSTRQQYKNANYGSDSDLIDIFSNVPSDLVAGEFLGKLLDDNGEPVTESQVDERIRNYVTQIDLELLKERIRINDARVWLVAAREYKIRPTLMAIRHGLVNCIVVDEEIAEKLLKIDIESNDTYKI